MDSKMDFKLLYSVLKRLAKVLTFFTPFDLRLLQAMCDSEATMYRFPCYVSSFNTEDLPAPASP